MRREETLKVYFDLDGSYKTSQGEWTVPQKKGQLILTPKELPATVTEEEFKKFRLKIGLPVQGLDFDNEMLLCVGDEEYVSYTKGCYLGQEVVERIRSRGHVNKKLCGLLLDGSAPARPGDAIIAADDEVGKITSSVSSVALNRPIALGYIHKDFWSPGTNLSVRQVNGSIAATVTTLPFVTSSPSSS